MKPLSLAISLLLIEYFISNVSNRYLCRMYSVHLLRYWILHFPQEIFLLIQKMSLLATPLHSPLDHSSINSERPMTSPHQLGFGSFVQDFHAHLHIKVPHFEM